MTALALAVPAPWRLRFEGLIAPPAIRRSWPLLAAFAAVVAGTLGVTTQRNGQFRVDATRLAAALNTDPDNVEALLVRLTAPAGALGNARAALGTSDSFRLAREQRNVGIERAALDTRSAALKAQLTRQYAAMERAVGGFKATGSYLDQQIKAWNRAD